VRGTSPSFPLFPPIPSAARTGRWTFFHPLLAGFPSTSYERIEVTWKERTPGRALPGGPGLPLSFSFPLFPQKLSFPFFPPSIRQGCESFLQMIRKECKAATTPFVSRTWSGFLSFFPSPPFFFFFAVSFSAPSALDARDKYELLQSKTPGRDPEAASPPPSSPLPFFH